MSRYQNKTRWWFGYSVVYCLKSIWCWPVAVFSISALKSGKCPLYIVALVAVTFTVRQNFFEGGAEWERKLHISQCYYSEGCNFLTFDHQWKRKPPGSQDTYVVKMTLDISVLLSSLTIGIFMTPEIWHSTQGINIVFFSVIYTSV